MYFSKSHNIEKPEPEFCNIYDTNWQLQDFHQKSLSDNKEYKKPEELDKMIEISEKLSKKIKFLRVDFYIVNDKIFFGEMTFFPGAGLSKFYPEKYDNILGNMIDLTEPSKKKEVHMSQL